MQAFIVTFAYMLGSEQYHIIIQLNKSSVRDRSFSRKLKVSGLSFYPKVIQGIFIPSFIF
jgi:hypothetical protein